MTSKMERVRRTFAVIKKVVFGLVVLAVIAGAVYYAPQLTARNEEPAAKITRPPLTVAVVEAQQAPISDFEFADGTARSTQREYLVFRTAGRVAFLKTNDDGGPLREGDAVASGELLAELDRSVDDANIRTARAELESTRVRLTNAKSLWDRTQRLLTNRAISSSEADSREAAYKQALSAVRSAEARVDQASANLRDIQIRSPFDGVVSFVNIREGQYVNSSGLDTSSEKNAARTAPITIINPDTFEIIVEVPVISGERVQVGQTAYVLDEKTLAVIQKSGYDRYLEKKSLADMVTPARVGSVSPAIDPGGRSIRVRVVTDEEIEGLRDGTYVSVWIEVDRREDATVVPLEAVIERSDEMFAFVLDPAESVVHRRDIEIGLFGSEGVEVTSGIQPGDLVVTKGRQRLVDGMKVRTNSP